MTGLKYTVTCKGWSVPKGAKTNFYTFEEAEGLAKEMTRSGHPAYIQERETRWVLRPGDTEAQIVDRP